jgi:ABC-type multidrug transport system ATPase subunit
LFSSHILAEVQEVSSRILVIHRGRLRADGTPHQLVAGATRRTLHLVARSGEPELRVLLAGLDGVHATRVTPAGEGLAAAVLELDADADPTAVVAQRLAAAGVPVHELRIELPSLEEYFHAITEGSDAAEERSAAALVETR